MSETKSYTTAKSVILSAPLPQQTRTYKPISNQQLVDLTLNGIEKAGYSLERETYLSAKEGNVALGRYNIKGVEDMEMQLQVSWRNSYDKSLPLIYMVGCIIKVCNNGLMRSIGGGSFKKKHQGQIQEFTPVAITEYIKRAADTFVEIQKERELMKEIELTKTLQAQLCGEMFIEHEFIKSTQLNIVKRELECPTYDYGNPNSLWSLFNYTTFSMREIHPSLYAQDHLDAYSFFTDKAGIILPKQSIPVSPVIPSNQLELELIY